MSHLYEDRAATLGRIGGTLESLIDALNTMRGQFSMVPDAERPAALARYAALLERAKTWRWYLEVQREAIGLTRHESIDELYRLPPAEPV
jgi:hypothetical protein